MESNSSTTLCRICLEKGAIYPIFDLKNDILTKISVCVKEKIEDIDGYPRNLCELCKTSLDTACDFINKYQQSSKILGDNDCIVKEENTLLSDYNSNDLSEAEIDLTDIKSEPKENCEIFEDSGYFAELVKPLQLKIKNNELRVRKIKTEVKSENEPVNKKRKYGVLKVKQTSKIASSLLEGEFSWTGLEWCLKSNKVSKVSINKQRDMTKIIKREIKLKIPKVKLPPPPKLCDLCGEVFRNQERLNLHKRKKHAHGSPVNCPHCKKVLISDYYLKRHIKRKHMDNEKNFICSACGRAFAFKGELSSHYKNVHNKHLKPKRVYECKICNKTYKCTKSVIVHERSVHTGHRPAICSVCDSSFYHEDYLKEHMRLHTGETPFKCPVCNRGYAQRGNMKSHIRIHRISDLDAETLSRIKPNYLRLLKP